MKTIDGGQNWESINSGTDTNLNAIFILDSSCCIVVGDNGTRLKKH